jgi:hypothetical protein
MIAQQSELRFHVLRLGSRKEAAKLYGVSMVRYYQDLPVTDFDHYRRGQMVMIGSVLAKKCLKCETARELQYFWIHTQSKSGCRETCEFCRIRQSEAAYLDLIKSP